MRCEKAIARFLDLDQQERLPLALRLHLAHCAKCRNEVRSLSQTFHSLGDVSGVVMPRDMGDGVMRMIRLSATTYGRSMSLFNWMSGEILIIASLVLIQFNDPRVWLEGHFGGSLEVPLNIVLGLVITVYSSVFIGTHLKEFKGFVGRVQKKFGQ